MCCARPIGKRHASGSNRRVARTEGKAGRCSSLAAETPGRQQRRAQLKLKLAARYFSELLEGKFSRGCSI
ncbi:hypothetical protein NL676_019214 [Syzygium grande]|nr:hypothetical protein NL676_019214 [Syzygium grande]